MLMINLIVMLVMSIAIYQFILWFNRYTHTYARYEFFTMNYSIAMVSSYALMFFGYNWMHSDSDVLNGAIVMGIGIFIFISVMIKNFANTPRLFAIAGSLAQIVLYVPISIGAVFIVALMLGFAGQTKPVYNLNSKE